MKTVVCLLTAMLLWDATTAQFVGIGNTSPNFLLDLSGRMRIRGGADNNTTAGLWLSGTASDSAIEKLFIGMRNDSTVGFYGASDGWLFNMDTRNGYLGLVKSLPSKNYPLAFGSTSGGKISLYAENNGNDYGLGIGSATLQLITPHATSSVVFGYGSSGSFTENMRVGGNGNVSIGTNDISLAGLTVNKKVGAAHAIFGSNTTGVAIESSFPGIGFNAYFSGSRKTIATGYSGYIGVNPSGGGMQLLVSTQSNNTNASGTYKTAIDIRPDGKVGVGNSDPAYLLDVGDRMRIRATPGFTAGIWLNNEANTAIPAFIGMQADNLVGFFGSGSAGWGLLMNTQTGAISFGGNTGVAGQVLTSNGSGSAPSWQGGVGGGRPFVVRPSANSPDLGTSGRVDVPNMVANFTLTAPSQVVFQYKLSIANRGCIACGERRTFIVLIQNIVGGTTDIATTTVYTPNQETADGVSGPIVLDLAAGTYSYKLAIAPSIFGAATVYARQQEGIFTWQIYPN
jgi:hypothetical protein